MPEVIYTEMHGKWAWALKSPNGHILAHSHRTYGKERDARRAFRKLLLALRPMVHALEAS